MRMIFIAFGVSYDMTHISDMTLISDMISQGVQRKICYYVYLCRKLQKSSNKFWVTLACEQWKDIVHIATYVCK